MRLPLVIAYCLLLTVGVSAQTRHMGANASTETSTSPFGPVTYGALSLTPVEGGLSTPDGAAARFTAGSGQDSNRYDEMVTRQMREFDRGFTTRGLSRTTDVIRGSLANGRSTTYTYRMTAGRMYGFAAVCDQDCGDLDLVLINERGRTVERDVARDDKPLIAYKAEESGTYRLRVSMAECSQSPCRFGLAVYQPTESTGGGGSSGGGSNRYDEMVTRQMRVFDRFFSEEGLSRTSNLVRGSLDHRKSTTYTYRMAAGRMYGFAAVCDQDCGDLDLIVLNEDGRVVKRDIENDDKPIVIYRPGESGTYTLRVSMAECSQSPCRFGLAVYQPTQGSKKF